MTLWWWWLTACLSMGDWGFYGHRLINRAAVYTLPTEMLGWYKPHIDYIAEHAVDPDKRRYATRHEAVRHYMDLDHWGSMPFEHVPRQWDRALALNLEVYALEDPDTVFLLRALPPESWESIDSADFQRRLTLVRRGYMPTYYDDPALIEADSLRLWLDSESISDQYTWRMRDAFSGHGILPYHLQSMQRRLTSALRDRDLEQVLRLSADFGHYIGDACVPLHTTKNYNGQLTDQIGIHAFWESRIPELFAISEFDLLVGSATYISDPTEYFWQLVLDSHAEVDRVLAIERRLRNEFPTDQQMCFEDRLNQNVLMPCEPFARAYHEAMDRMVEARFRAAIKALGDAWYTAWIDAGQPPAPEHRQLARNRTPEDDELDQAVKGGKQLGREHGQ